jgi:hypothetical protein
MIALMKDAACVMTDSVVFRKKQLFWGFLHYYEKRNRTASTVLIGTNEVVGTDRK